jgi:hypothetical protein
MTTTPERSPDGTTKPLKTLAEESSLSKQSPSLNDGWSQRKSFKVVDHDPLNNDNTNASTKKKGNTKSLSASTSSDKPLIQVESFLSHPAYQLGSSLVGTVLIRHPQNNQKDGRLRQPLRTTLKSVVVYAAGFCRIDKRWHNVSEYTRIYGQMHPFIQQLDFDAKLLRRNNGNSNNDTVCFWATNGLDLLTLPERSKGKFLSSTENEGDERLAFTFRVELPIDLPHSMNAESCKYYYLMNILIKTQSKQKIIHTPFVILTNPSKPMGISSLQKQPADKTRSISAGRVKFGSCVGMAHSIGLPYHLNATEIHRPKGQMTVALSRRRTDVQTLQVSNAAGKPVCLMTFINATTLTPGSRVLLQWDFPESPSENDWVPCHQISACLMGEELAIYEDGKTSRTQQHVFDTCHEYIYPGITQLVSKSLLLSLEAPCNIYTDVMELSVKCQVDITVKEFGKYNNLRIEIPVHVVHNLDDDKNLDFELEKEENVLPLAEMMGPNKNPHQFGDESGNENKEQTTEFPTNDIIPELKLLALQMEQRLNKKEGLS